MQVLLFVYFDMFTILQYLPDFVDKPVTQCGVIYSYFCFSVFFF